MYVTPESVIGLEGVAGTRRSCHVHLLVFCNHVRYANHHACYTFINVAEFVTGQ